jgi:hypothetical protein
VGMYEVCIWTSPCKLHIPLCRGQGLSQLSGGGCGAAVVAAACLMCSGFRVLYLTLNPNPRVLPRVLPGGIAEAVVSVFAAGIHASCLLWLP